MTDLTEFNLLQKYVGKELTCENSDCKYYALGRRCRAPFKGTVGENNYSPIDYTVFINPYLCKNFWEGSSLAVKHREESFLKVFTCKNRSFECTQNNTNWAMCMCMFCKNYIENRC